jgi:hypothetical protein
MIHPASQLHWSEAIEVHGGQPGQRDIRVSPDHLPKGEQLKRGPEQRS